MGLRHPHFPATLPPLCRQSEDFSSGAAVGCASTVVLVVAQVQAVKNKESASEIQRAVLSSEAAARRARSSGQRRLLSGATFHSYLRPTRIPRPGICFLPCTMQGIGLRICRDFFGGCLFPAQQITERASIFKNELCFRFHSSMNYGTLAQVSFPKLQPKLALPGSLKHTSSRSRSLLAKSSNVPFAVTEAKERKHRDRSIPVTELPRAVYLCPLHLELLDTHRFSFVCCCTFSAFWHFSCCFLFFYFRSNVALPTLLFRLSGTSSVTAAVAAMQASTQPQSSECRTVLCRGFSI